MQTSAKPTPTTMRTQQMKFLTVKVSNATDPEISTKCHNTPSNTTAIASNSGKKLNEETHDQLDRRFHKCSYLAMTLKPGETRHPSLDKFV
jgi:hypothetical protein